MNLLSRALYERPITASCLFLSGLLFAGVLAAQAQGLPFRLALESWGAVNELALYDGEWWRIFVSAFHHGGVLHLVLNTMVVWYLGGLVEPRLGSLRYGGFVLAAMAFSGVAQSFHHSFVGLSGFAYALFGVLLVMRKYDPDLPPRFDDRMVRGGFIWLFLCVVLTQLQLLAIANIAHFAGLAYGWLAGQALFTPFRRKLVARSFLAAHLLLLPGFYLVTHPFWNGRYHWRIADRSDDPEVKFRHWQKAVERDADLAGAWFNVALTYFQRGDLLEAWETILRGIYINRGYRDGIDLARLIWSNLRGTSGEDEARKILADVFGPEAKSWEPVVMAPPSEQLARAPAATEEEEKPVPPPGSPLLPQESSILIEPFVPARRPQKLPAPDPDAPGSAEEGTRA